MKKLLILLLILPSLVEARNCNVVVGQPTSVATAACTACPSDSDGGDLVCEDFEGAGYRCSSYTETTTNCTTLDEDAAHTGAWVTACTDYGDQAIKVVYTASTGECHTRKNTALTDDTFVQFYLNVDDIGTLASGSFEVFSAGNDSGMFYYVKAAYHSASQYHIYLTYKDTSSAWQIYTGTTLLDIDKFYRININTNASGSTIEVKVQGSSEISKTDYSTSGLIKKFYIGALSDPQESAAFFIDMLKIDNDTEPSGCTT